MSDPTTPIGIVEMFDFMCDHDVELQSFREFVELRESMARNEALCELQQQTRDRASAARDAAFAMVERELLATGADYITLQRIRPVDKSWGHGSPLGGKRKGVLMQMAEMLKERGDHA